MTVMEITDAIRSRFLAKIHTSQVPTDCWEWQASCFKTGYGAFGVGRTVHYAHRLAYLIFKGVDPAGSLVCHSCDNRKCVNPHHLWLGSHADNARDMAEKNRSTRGERNPMAKYSDAFIEQIRLLVSIGVSYRTIERDLGISRGYISELIQGKRRA